MNAGTITRHRPRSLPSATTKLNTEYGNLYVTVCLDEDGQPFEVFGSLGKGGSFQYGVTELACRLISLHLRRGTPIEEIIEQCQGIQEMQPYVNPMPDGRQGVLIVMVVGTRGGSGRLMASKRSGAKRRLCSVSRSGEAARSPRCGRRPLLGEPLRFALGSGLHRKSRPAPNAAGFQFASGPATT